MAKKEATPIDKPYGFVVYTDGGARPTNPGYGGYGFHGYVYSDQPPKKGSGNKDYILTEFGYIGKGDKVEHSKDDDKGAFPEIRSDAAKQIPVKPLSYINGHGTIPGLVSNNVAEITAATWALQYAKENSLKDVKILTDSKGMVDAVNGHIKTWQKNDWMKSNGEPVKNQEYWKNLIFQNEALISTGAKVCFEWIRAHNGHVGNETADKLATMGVMRARAGESHNSLVIDPAEGYWSRAVDKHPLLAQKRMYLSTQYGANKPGEYYMGNHGKDDDLLAQRSADGYYSYVKLNEPDVALEVVIRRQEKAANGENSLVMVRLDKVFETSTHLDLVTYGDACLYVPSSKRMDLCHISYNPGRKGNDSDVGNQPITKELNPPRLSMRAIESVNILKGILDAVTKESHPGFLKTEITNLIFDQDQKDDFKLKPSFISGFTKLDADINYGYEGKSVNIEITLGVDMPERNTLKKLEKLKPKITTVTWMESVSMFRYVTIIEVVDAVGIFGGMYSNARFVKS